MLTKYMGKSGDFFQYIGAVVTVYIAFKIAMNIFRFIAKHFLSDVLGLPANLKKAGSWAGEFI